jgi:cobalt/nickel transport system permease protein
VSANHSAPVFAEIDSPVRRLPAVVKLGSAFVFVAAVALVPATRWAWAAAALLLVFAVAVAARVALRGVLARLAMAEPFVLGLAVLTLFQGRGLVLFTAVVLKSTACVGALQLFARTTPLSDLLDLLRRARLTGSFVIALALAHRYLFVLAEESRRMRRARRARTWHTSRASEWRALSSVVAVSFVRSVTRAERTATALRARGLS